MHREKSIACHDHMIAASSSSCDDDNVSLGVDQEEAFALTHDAASSSAIPQRKRQYSFTAGSIHLQVRDTLKGRTFNVSLFCFEVVCV